MQRNTGFRKYIFQHAVFLSFLIGLLFLFAPFTNAFARDVSFQWTANTDTPSIDGYRLYYKIGDPGQALSDYSGTNATGGNPSPVGITGKGTTSYTLPNLLDSEKYSFVLTAYRGQEESPPTNAVTLQAVAPPTVLKAMINANVLTGKSPLPVTFDATASTGSVVTYNWTYGDGTTGTGAIANHTFSSAGSYTVTLKVTDTIGATDQATVSIVVTNTSTANNPPSAVISSSASVGTSPLSVDFNGSASTDNDGSIVSYGWDFADGGAASGALANHIYATAGTFNAKLTVTDNGGLTGMATTPVLVTAPAGGSNKAPTAIIISSTVKGYAPLTVSFNAGQSYDTDGKITSYLWSFGDGTTATGVKVKHEFLQAAVYNVTLKVKDNKGSSSLPATSTITVLDTSQQRGSLAESITQALLGVYHLLLGPSSK